MADIVMPRLSDSMEEGIIVQWYVEDGQRVEVGQLLAEIETDKATMDYESDLEGTITLLAKEGDVIPLGQAIARVNEDGKDLAEETQVKEMGTEKKEETPEPAAFESSDVKETRASKDRVVASPVARRIAEREHLALQGLKGSGPAGRILKKDVQTALNEKSPAAGEAEEEKAAKPLLQTEKPESRQELTKIEEIGARRMSESTSSIPHFYLQRDLDITDLQEGREGMRDKADPLPSLNDFFIRAAGRALESHPRLRAYYEDGAAVIYEDINIGIATATDQGLVVPVIKEANKKSVSDIASESRALAQAARRGDINPVDISSATFTISNLGMYEVDSFSAIITPKQSSVLALGAAKEKVCFKDGQMMPRQIISVTLSCDHRIIDGERGALFLKDLAWRVETALGAAI